MLRHIISDGHTWINKRIKNQYIIPPYTVYYLAKLPQTICEDNLPYI
jgi:hypothetical protein